MKTRKAVKSKRIKKKAKKKVSKIKKKVIKKKSVKKLTRHKVRHIKKEAVYAMSVSGISDEKLAEKHQVTERTIRNWKNDVEATIYSSPEWSKALIEIKKMLPKSVKVVNNYLDGDGEQTGGDLRAAFKILERFDILKESNNLTTKLEQHNTFTFNSDIKVESVDDEVFAKTAINELRKVISIFNVIEDPETSGP